ncbi:MAG TPA: hypothetical protein VK969_10545, partial [Acidimicrobiia bacterium]|nr:hypothetical protein [Acidimicrobiia bacterium]
GREGSTTTMVISLVILVPMLVWGVLGFGNLNESGELNGGCTVNASSDLDSTTVTDTSRSDPFEIDANGGLTWEATSPEAFMDYEWEIHTIVGGITVPIESDTESNEAGDTENGGDVSDVGALAESRGIDLDLYTGVYVVGGNAASCDGFGFVNVVGDELDLITVAAIVLLVLLIILFLIIVFAGRKTVVETSEVVVERSNEVVVEPDESGSHEHLGDADDT